MTLPAKDQQIIFDNHFGLMQHGKEKMRLLAEAVFKIKEDEEGYHMGNMILLEAMACMYFAMHTKRNDRKEIMGNLVKIVKATAESGILDAAKAKSKQLN